MLNNELLEIYEILESIKPSEISQGNELEAEIMVPTEVLYQLRERAVDAMNEYRKQLILPHEEKETEKRKSLH